MRAAASDRGMGWPGRRLIVVVVLAGCLTAATAHRVCDLVFDCGCTWGFAGAAAHCNIHAPQPPHCPACHASWPAAALGLALLGVWAGVLRAVVPGRQPDP
ncbi:MAG: hypothetical protein ACREBE_17490 [bacterium]